MSLTVNGVTFDGLHSYNDFGLWLSERPDLGSPEPKLNTIEVSGSDGVIDMTEANSGEVKFNNRTIKLVFTAMVDVSDQTAFKDKIMNALHGRVIQRLVLDEDPDWWYTGRAKVEFSSIKSWKLKCNITIDAAPYAMAKDETVLNLNTATSSLHEIEQGENVSAQAWNSDFRLGTQEFPNGIYSGGLQQLVIAWPANATMIGSTIRVQVIDSDGDIYNTTFPNPGSQASDTRITFSSLTSAGISLSKVWRVLVSGIGGCRLYVEQVCYKYEVNNERKTIVPEWYVTDAVDSPTMDVINLNIVRDDGSSSFYALKPGLTYTPDIVLQSGHSTLFVGMISGATVTDFSVKFRKGKL